MAAPAAAAAAVADGIHAQLPELLRAVQSSQTAKGLLQAYAQHFADEAAFKAVKRDVYAIIAVSEGLAHPQLVLNSLHPRGKGLAASVAALLAAYGLVQTDADSKSAAFVAACQSDAKAKETVNNRWKYLRKRVAEEIRARAVEAGGGGVVAAGAGDEDDVDADAEADGGAARTAGARAPARQAFGRARGRKKRQRVLHDEDGDEGQEQLANGAEAAAAANATAATDSVPAAPRRPPRLALATAVAGLLMCREQLAALLGEPVTSGSSASGAAAAASPTTAAAATSFSGAAPASPTTAAAATSFSGAAAAVSPTTVATAAFLSGAAAATSPTSATAASTSSSSASVSLPSGAAPAWLARPRGREWARRLLDVLTEVPDDVSADFVSDGAVGSKRPRSRQSRISSAFVLTMPALVRVPFIATHLTQLLSYAPYTRAQEAAYPRDTYLPRAGDYVIPLENGMAVGRLTSSAVRLLQCVAPAASLSHPSACCHARAVHLTPVLCRPHVLRLRRPTP